MGLSATLYLCIDISLYLCICTSDTWEHFLGKLAFKTHVRILSDFENLKIANIGWIAKEI